MYKNHKTFTEIRLNILKVQEKARKAVNKNKRILSKEEGLAFWKIKNNIFKKQFPIVEKKMIELFSKQMKETVPKLDSYKGVFKVNSTDVYKKIKLDKKKQVKRTLRLTLNIFGDIYEEAGNETFTMMEVDMLMDMDREDVKKFIDVNAKKFASSVNDTTNLMLKKELVEGFAAGEKMPEIKKRISGVFKGSMETRAEMIARTETLRYNAHATEQAFVDSGIVEGKQWIANPNACPQCADLNGTTVGLGKKFLDKGGMINEVVFDYEDIVAPPLHPSCECDLIPIYK